jgi:site-specific DNA recombinase
VVIDEELRPIVREVYERIIAGESAGLVARSLNMRAIPSPAMVLAQRQGKEVRQIAWSQRTIWEMVQNPYYAGEAAYDRRQRTLPERVKKRYRNKEKSSDRARAPEDWVRASVPAIVSEAEQQAAKEALQRGRKYRPRNTKGQYLLRGLLRCPLCGKRLASRREHPGTPKEWRYYRCTTLHQLPGSTRTRTCPTRVVAKEVEPLVVEYLAGCLEDEEALRAAFLELRSSPERERGQWEARLADLAAQEERARSRLRGAQEMREDGEYTAAEFAERKAQLTEEIAALRREMAEVQGYLGQARHQEGLWVSLEAFCREMAGRLRESEGPECFPQRQRTVQALVDAIDVHPERFDVEGVFGAALERSASMGR